MSFGFNPVVSDLQGAIWRQVSISFLVCEEHRNSAM